MVYIQARYFGPEDPDMPLELFWNGHEWSRDAGSVLPFSSFKQAGHRADRLTSPLDPDWTGRWYSVSIRDFNA